MGIYRITTQRKKGPAGEKIEHVKVKMTSKEIKAFIMKQNKWTTDQYNKQYDILRNKLRSYEAYERKSGRIVEKQSVRELLFKEAKARQNYGDAYTPSIKMQRIKSFTSVSSGKAGQKALEGKLYQRRRKVTYEDATARQFEGFLKDNEGARFIYESIDDPVKREKALSDYADKLHAKIKENDEVVENEAMPYGETFGSDEQIDFDINAYM